MVYRLKKINVDIEEFKRFHAEGMTNKEIANVLGFSLYTVRKIRCNLGQSPLANGQKVGVSIVVDDDILKSLYANGLSDKEIGSVCGVSVKTIVNQRKSLCLFRWKKWENTASNIEKFKKLHAEGLNDKKIANIFDLSRETARKIRHNLGLPPQKLNRKHVDTEELKNLFAEGLSDAEIGKFFGVCDRTISDRRRRLGLFRQMPKSRPIKQKDIDIDELKQLYRSGMSDVEIGKAIGIPQYIVFRIRHNLGLAPNRGKLHWEMRELYGMGMSDGKIAEILKVKRYRVTTWRQSHELSANDPADAIADAFNVKLSKPDETEE